MKQRARTGMPGSVFMVVLGEFDADGGRYTPIKHAVVCSIDNVACPSTVLCYS